MRNMTPKNEKTLFHMNRVALPDPEFQIQSRVILIRCGMSQKKERKQFSLA